MKKNSLATNTLNLDLAAIQQLANQTAEAKREKQKEKQAAELAQKQAAERLARKNAAKEQCKTYCYLVVQNQVFSFPKTDVSPAKFAANLAALGQNPDEYKLVAVKPRNSTPIQVPDLRIAVRRANIALVALVKGSHLETVENSNGEGYTVKGTFTGTRLAWPHLTAKSDTQFLSLVRKGDLGIWYE